MLGPIPYRPWACPLLFLRCDDPIRSAPFRPRTASVGILIGAVSIPRGAPDFRNYRPGSNMAPTQQRFVPSTPPLSVTERSLTTSALCCGQMPTKIKATTSSRPRLVESRYSTAPGYARPPNVRSCVSAGQTECRRRDFNHEYTSLGDLLGRLTASPPPPIRH
jgi:hypothetical protein